MASQEATDATHIDVDVEDLKPEAVEEPKTPSIFYQMMAEALGTMFIVVVGVNAVHGAVLAQGAAGNFQVGMMFALGYVVPFHGSVLSLQALSWFPCGTPLN